MSFPLAPATARARELREQLAPFCERIEIAGSIRRERPLVRDIDLVAIPKMASKASLFGGVSDPRETDLADALRERFEVTFVQGKCVMRGLVDCMSAVSLDVYFATPETWATTMLIRTGSKEHNIWMCERARQVGGKLHADGSDLELPGQYDPLLQRTINMRMLRAKEEAEIFRALGFAEPPPRSREIGSRGRPEWLSWAAVKR